jgi:hypothetical protein
MKDTTHCVRHGMTFLLVLVIGYTSLADNRSQSKDKKPDRQPAAGFLLTAVTQKDVIRFDEPLKLGLTIKNVSKWTRFIRETFVTEQYRLIVLNERGDPVALTKYGEKELKPREDHYGQAVKTINPGEESRDTIEVNKLYEMSSAGTYSITAWRVITFDKDGKEAGPVQSNTVKVRVTN